MFGPPRVGAGVGGGTPLKEDLLSRPEARCAAQHKLSVWLFALRTEHYFDVETGYGKWIPRWGGNDGPDDAAENGLNWTVLYALGAAPTVLELWKRGYEGHIKQYTEAKTVEVPMAREGMYYRDFSVMFDFFHHTESLSAFTLSGLADPFDTTYADRTKRFAAMYMGDDPEAPNYDKVRLDRLLVHLTVQS